MRLKSGTRLLSITNKLDRHTPINTKVTGMNMTAILIMYSNLGIKIRVRFEKRIKPPSSLQSWQTSLRQVV